MAAFKYRAFISYSHADRRWGDWLHKALETYTVPKRLIGRHTAAGPIPERLGKVFRDRDELASATDLGQKVDEALRESANLVVICSPRSALSHWVNEEVLAYKRLGRAGRVFCLIVDGEPFASGIAGREADECFAPALRFRLDADGRLGTEAVEPIAADARSDGDGKANAKLKLIAGLLDVDFDALKQREQRRAHRRLVWVASLAVVGMLVMSGLTFAALRARDQAQFQRDQAENLIGFMLGNLRDKLEAVNRLDILDDVADHAINYFDAPGNDLSSPQARAKNAEALLLIGRVRLDQGQLAEARKAFTSALRMSSDLVDKQGNDPALRIAVADAHLWIGMCDWQAGKPEAALKGMTKALPIAKAVADAHPDNEDWVARLGWVHTNLGQIYEQLGQGDRALREYAQMMQVDKQLSARHPQEARYQQQLANDHETMGQLMYASGDLRGAEQHYVIGREALQALSARNPRNDSIRADLATADVYHAQTAKALGSLGVALESLRHATGIADAMLQADPDSLDKLSATASYRRRLGHVLRLSGDTRLAKQWLEAAVTSCARMLQLAPEDGRGKSRCAALALERARLAWQTGDGALALHLAMQAREDYAAMLAAGGDDQDTRVSLAGAELLLGDIADKQVRQAEARAAWLHAGAALAPLHGTHDPDVLAMQVLIGQRIGEPVQLQLAALAGMGYRDPGFIAQSQLGIDVGMASSPATDAAGKR